RAALDNEKGRGIMSKRIAGAASAMVVVITLVGLSHIAASGDQPSSYAPVDIKQDIETTIKKMQAAKADVEKRQKDLLNERYDLADHPAQGVTRSRGKPVQAGPRTKLPAGVTWKQLADMAPEDVREKGLFPKGFLPLPHANHPEGGMVFPKQHIDEVKKQEDRDL